MIVVIRKVEPERQRAPGPRGHAILKGIWNGILSLFGWG
jgi:hypothetical protein